MASIRLDLNAEGMSKSQQAIANYVAGALQQIPFSTEEDIAKAVGVSTATVSRFWAAIGFDNLKAFKKHLQESEQETPAGKMKHILSKVDAEEADVIAEITEIAATNLTVSAERIDRSHFSSAVKSLYKADTIYVYGTGASACVSELLSFRLGRIGKRVIVMAGSGRQLLETLAHAGAGDTVLLFGFVKRSPELTVLLEHSDQAGYTTVLVTDLLVSDMLAESDIVLQIDRGAAHGFHSMTAPIALAEALAVGVTKLGGGQALDQLEKLQRLRRQYAALLPK
ncbi:SIS domain-containing protein [Paenibacillus sp. NEAU-GSW1]|nr:SIS domain-containing protein [Paenibacillus sp. NEAU-GSW1]